MVNYYGIFYYVAMMAYKVDNNEHHQESCVLDHALQVYDIVKREDPGNDELLVAALLHDLGKTIRDESLKKSPNHEKDSIIILKNHGYNNGVVFDLIDNHMRIHKYLDGEMTKLGKIQKLINHPRFRDMVILSRADKKGRQKRDFQAPTQHKLMDTFYDVIWRTHRT